MLAYFRDDLFRGLRGVDRSGIRGFFEIGKLAGENLLAGVVPFSRTQALAKQFVGSLQIDELYIGIDLQQLTIAALQRGACQDNVPSLRLPFEHRIANAFEPRDAVLVAERNPVRHFFNVRGRVKIVAIRKIPLEMCGEQFADGRLSRSGGAHQENDHGNIIAG